MILDHSALLEAAHRRTLSEDAILVDADCGLYAVADGMGGRPGGARASDAATRAFRDFLRFLDPADRTTRARLVEGVSAAGDAVLALSRADPSLRGAGTTLCAAVIRGGVAAIVHVGDSRAYLLRGGAVTQVTRDQTLAAELVARNIITETTAEQHPFRNVLSQAVGSDAPIDPDIVCIPLVDGDRFLLATDGLTKALSFDRIQAVVADAGFDPGSTTRALMRAALEERPEDDIAILLVRIRENEPDGAEGVRS